MTRQSDGDKVMATNGASHASSWAGVGAAAIDSPDRAANSPTESSLAAAIASARKTKHACGAAIAVATTGGCITCNMQAEARAEKNGMAQAAADRRMQLAAAREQAMEGIALGDWNMHEEAVSSMIQLSPCSTLYNQRAKARLMLGRITDSEADARHAISLCPSSPRGHRRLARALCEQSRLVEAGDEIIESRFLGDESDVETEM